MTEAMPIDLSGKIISNSKPPAPGSPKPPDKPESKGPTGDKPGESPPAPGSKTFLGWVARSISAKQLTIVAAAVCSLAAGIFAVRLIWPEEPPAANATASLLSEPTATEPIVPPRTGPTLTLEPPKPAEFIPPAGVPMPPAPAASSTIPPPSGLETLPAIPVPGSSPASPGSSAGPMSPLSPAASPPSTPPAIPSPESLVPAVLPAGGTDNRPSPPPGTSSLPMIPSSPPSSLPAAPARDAPARVAGDASDRSTREVAEPKPPVTGMPPSRRIRSSLPSMAHRNCPPPDGAEPQTAGYSRLGRCPRGQWEDGVRQAGRQHNCRRCDAPPSTSYDVDIYHPRANDTWESISREYFNDTR